MDAQERRARLVRRHHLAAAHRATTPLDVARSLVALHSTDPASVYLSCMARTVAGDTASVDRALYVERSLVRMLGMRRTVFVVPAAMVPVVHAACTQAIAVRERRKLVQLLEQAGIAGPSQGARWLEQVEEETLAALRQRGDAVGQELSADVPSLREQISFGDETKKWAGVISVTTRVLFLLAAEGRIVRGRPRGSWTSSQYRWALRTEGPCDGSPASAPEMARVDLARRWLANYGPATPGDLKWWSGWTMGETKRALASIAPLDVDMDGQAGVVLADDAAPVGGPLPPGAVLLPALDPSVMGWAGRGWFLGDPAWRPALFDRSGNAGPTAWWDGQVVGGWGQRGDGEIVVRVLRDIGTEASAALAAATDRLRVAIGDVRVTPRFRTPLERELTA
jgi:hypothetical protein